MAGFTRVVAWLLALFLAACATVEAPRGPFQVKVIAFNDFHGNLHSPGSFGNGPPVGGADYLAAHVARMKAANPLNAVVGAGDFIGATPLVSALFGDEPTVDVMNALGLEFNAVGNHEFDRGAAHLLRLQQRARFQWLAANVIAAESGKTLLPPYGIKRFRGVDVAFIGMTLRGTPSIVSASGIAGLAFRDEAETVNRLVPELRARGIEAIVVLVHEGGVQRGPGADINGCEGGLAGSAIARIVRRLDDAVDLVVAGHTHSAFNCRLPNAAGRGVLVTSANAYGRMLTDIDLTIDPATRDVTASTANNRLVVRNDPAIVADAGVARIVAEYAERAAPLANRVVGTLSRALPNTRADSACNMPAGELIADAMLEATKDDAAIAFMNGGGVRSPGFRGGDVTYAQAFTVQPFGNSLVTLTLTRAQLRDLLEEQFAGCRGQSRTTTRVMVPSAGFHYTWDAGRACGHRIREATLTSAAGTESLVKDGAAVDPARPIRVTVNSYMADGGDGLSTLASAGERRGGPQDIDALVAYLAKFKAPAKPYLPGTRAEDGGRPRLNRIGSGFACSEKGSG